MEILALARRGQRRAASLLYGFRPIALRLFSPSRLDFRLLLLSFAPAPGPHSVWTFFPGFSCRSFPGSSAQLYLDSFPLAFSLDRAPCVHRALPEARKWGGREEGPVGVVPAGGCGAWGGAEILSRSIGAAVEFGLRAPAE